MTQKSADTRKTLHMSFKESVQICGRIINIMAQTLCDNEAFTRLHETSLEE